MLNITLRVIIRIVGDIAFRPSSTLVVYARCRGSGRPGHELRELWIYNTKVGQWLRGWSVDMRLGSGYEGWAVDMRLGSGYEVGQ